MATYLNNKSSKKRRILCDINITPFVDVLLVLLIIFMVAAPMMTSSISVDLPVGTKSATEQKNQNISVSIKSDGSIFLEEESIKLYNLTEHLLQITSKDFNSKILVRADKSLDYGRVMDIVRTISSSGFSQVVLVTELKQ
jgi:biopolymer transport protein TolR